MKKIIFYLIFFLLALTLAVGALLALDLFYHRKYDKTGGLNFKGYRGRILGKKEVGEIRIAMLGGSFIFGYGVTYDKAIPALVQEKLQKTFDDKVPPRKITVINLAFNCEGAYAFYNNLKDFRYLDYDYAVLCEGYNDTGIGNRTAYRHASPVFRIFGYMPILPLIIQEKKMALEHNGDLTAAYAGEKIVFNPNAKDRLKISLLQASLDSYNKIENVMQRISGEKEPDFNKKFLEKDKWAWYKFFTKKAIRFCLENGKKVVVITQPYLGEAHREQQDSLRRMLQEEFGSEPDLFYIDLGDALPQNDETLRFDGMHVTPAGSEAIAELIARELRPVLEKTFHS